MISARMEPLVCLSLRPSYPPIPQYPPHPVSPCTPNSPCLHEPPTPGTAQCRLQVRPLQCYPRECDTATLSPECDQSCCITRCVSLSTTPPPGTPPPLACILPHRGPPTTTSTWGRVPYLEGVLPQGAHHLPEGDLGGEGVAVVHHGLPIWPVPAIHLQAPAAPFQSPGGGCHPWNPALSQGTSSLPSPLPLGLTPKVPRVGMLLHAGHGRRSAGSQRKGASGV